MIPAQTNNRNGRRVHDADSGCHHCHQPSVKEVCLFLADYADWLFGSGATCIRMSRNMKRIAKAFGMQVEISVLPRHIHVTVFDPVRDHVFTSMTAIEERGINFNINTQLSKLSWAIADGVVSFDGARRRMSHIVKSGKVGRLQLLLFVAVANASFCRLFGGDLLAMVIVWVATAIGFFLKMQLTEWKFDFRFTVTLCAFVSSIIAAVDGIFGISGTPDVTMVTSVLYLVPGIPFINSFCDMLDRHYICAYGRAMNALVITACLSLGLFCGMIAIGTGMFEYRI